MALQPQEAQEALELLRRHISREINRLARELIDKRMTEAQVTHELGLWAHVQGCVEFAAIMRAELGTIKRRES